MDQFYRIYDIDHQGSIKGAMNRPFLNDLEALEHANRLLENYPAIEVWQTDRLVGRVERGAAVGAGSLAAADPLAGGMNWMDLRP